MKNELMRDKLIKLVIKDSVREVLLKYGVHFSNDEDFLDTTEKISHEIFSDVEILYQQYGNNNQEN